VTVTTSDGVELDAWYLPSANGAAIVLLGGCCSARDDQIATASLLARHGYGVLMLDVRGRGGSGGHAMLWGWWGEIDVRAGVDYLAGRPDVVDGRIGAIGMSVGGEQVIAAAGADPRIRAVVAEGVTARGAHDEGDPARGVGGAFTRYVDWASRKAAAIMTSADTPTPLRDAVRAMSQQRVLVIAAGTLPPEIDAAATFEALSPAVVTTWIAPHARHTKAYDAHPSEWEQRVVAFYDEALRSPAHP
jgi:predicted acyl esterase